MVGNDDALGGVQVKEPDHKKRNIALVLLLAVLCIGGVELAACRHFAPALYEQITAPVRAAFHTAADACLSLYEGACDAAEDAAGRAAQLWADLTAPKPEEEPPQTPDPEPEPDPEPDPEEQQLASEPTLIDHTPVSDPLITELREEDGQELLSGGVVTMVYFNQGDEFWAQQPYGSDPIGPYGCGPVAMAMVVASLTDIQADPVVMSQWAVDNGHWAKKGGSYLSIVEDAAQAFGLQAYPLEEKTPERLTNALFSSDLLVALMGPGHFTQKGHFIILRGVAPNGDILVADPNSRERSLSLWDPQLILDELSPSTNDGAPLWVISRPDG